VSAPPPPAITVRWEALVMVSAPLLPPMATKSPRLPQLVNVHPAAEKVPAAVKRTVMAFGLASPVICTVSEMRVPSNCRASKTAVEAPAVLKAISSMLIRTSPVIVVVGSDGQCRHGNLSGDMGEDLNSLLLERPGPSYALARPAFALACRLDFLPVLRPTVRLCPALKEDEWTKLRAQMGARRSCPTSFLPG
jgi:hypothetical protein